MINSVDLKYFIEVARTQHVSKAAERLGVTQPTLSYSLKRIETDMGLNLFERSKKGVKLTAAGHRLFEKSQELLEMWEQTKTAAQNETTQASGIIRLGCHTAVAQYTLPEILPQFLKNFPDIKIQLHHGLSRHINESLIADRLDVGFVINPTEHPDLVIKELLKDRVGFWRAKKIINEDTLILDPSLIQTQTLIKKAQSKGFKFKRFIESSSLEVIAQLVASGVGYGILPERVAKAFGGSDITSPADSPLYQDRMCLVYKPSFRSLMRGKVFIDKVSKLN